MLKMTLAACLTLGAIGPSQAADTKISLDPPTDAGCRTAHSILVDRQRSAVDGTFHFVDGDNMVCFRPLQSGRLVLKPALESAKPAGAAIKHPTAPIPRPNLAVRQTEPLTPAPPTSIPRVAGDGIPFRGALAFETGHTIPLTETRKLGTRIGGYLSQDRVSLNSIEVRLAQRF